MKILSAKLVLICVENTGRGTSETRAALKRRYREFFESSAFTDRMTGT
jgi:hypothetical protein